MKTINILAAFVVAALVPSISRAADAGCAGTADVSALEVGCDGEADFTVSLARCDFRAGKTPNIYLNNVIDGVSGNASVTISTVERGSFTVTLRPPPSYDQPGVCKVWRFDWAAE